MSDPIRVSLFDGTTLEFPADTPQAVIDGAAKRETTRLRVTALKQKNPAEYDPASSEYQAKYGATSGNNFLQNAAIGTGKAFTDIGLGAQQMVGAAPYEAAADKRALDAPIMSTAGGQLGYGLGAVAASAPVAMAAGPTVAGAALTGATFGAFQPSGSLSEHYLQTGRDAGYAALGQYGLGRLMGRAGSYTGRPQNAVGGLSPEGQSIPASARVAVPQGFENPSAATRATYAQADDPTAIGVADAAASGEAGATITANPNARVRIQSQPAFGEVGPDSSAGLTKPQARILETAKGLGFKTTPGVQSGSKVLQQYEAKAESQPWSSGPFFAIKNANQKTGNRIVAKALGVKGDVVDDRVFRQVSDRIGRVYDAVADERVRTVNPDEFLTKLSAIESDTQGLLANNASVSDHPLVNQLLNLVSGGKITGRQAQQLSTKLGRAVKTQMKTANGDRELGMALGQVKELTDDILAQGLQSDAAGAFNTARRQYRILMLAETPQVTNSANGNVSLANLANLLARTDKNGYTRGINQSDLYNAARFAQAFRPLVGDSGTATRSPVGTTVADVVLGVPINLATRAYASSASTAAAGAIGKSAAGAGAATEPVRQSLNNALYSTGQAAYPYLYPGTMNALLGDR